jgi:transcriptional regulator of acetoin/glycerol metabolism
VDDRRDKIAAVLESLIESFDVKSIQEFDSIAHEVLIRRALSKGKTSRETAKELGIGKSTMYRKMKEYGIEPKA